MRNDRRSCVWLSRTMYNSKTRRRTAFVLFTLEFLSIAHSVRSVFVDTSLLEQNANSDVSVVWHYYDDNTAVRSTRKKRNLESENEIPQQISSNVKHPIQDPQCREDLKRICGDSDNADDHLFVLPCVQSFKFVQQNKVSKIGDDCQHAIWKHIYNFTKNDNIRRLASNECDAKALKDIPCSLEKTSEHGAYLSCLIENRNAINDLHCQSYVKQLEWVAFSDFRIITPIADCQRDIEKFKCGNIQPRRESSQGSMLECLQVHANELEVICAKRIFHISEIQGENVKRDRQLYLACRQDHLRFCANVRPGTGQVYTCLMLRKNDRSMTQHCRDQLARREKLIASDYRVSKGLVKACKEDIKNNHCRRSVSDDKEIRLAQILLCLESVEKNGSKIDPYCRGEMLDHRKILMEDYRLSPEIVNGCANDITKFCNGLEVGGLTIHCLMDHTKTRVEGSRASTGCQRALEDLIRETDAGEDWRVDPVLREACQPVVEIACRDVRGGDARVISCLMEKIGTDKMTESCEAALLQIQYFIARDYKLDPQLYRACKSDAVQYCHAKRAWANDGTQIDPERGPLVLPCLHRYAYQPVKNVTLRPECLDELRRVMRQRAINVDLQPEIEDVCFNELSTFCNDKIAKGAEITCLQDKLEQLTPKCNQAVSNLTAEQAERVELNPVIMEACQRVMERHCAQVLRYGKDEGDMMECLIEHKNDLDSRSDYKCKAAVEHFQLLSLKSYHFTYKFKEACRPLVMRHCRESTTKVAVIECLGGIVREDAMNDRQPRIPKDCRQQLKMQLYQQQENVRFNPILQKACASDIKRLCYDVEPGNSQIFECLDSKKSKLSDLCHRQLFKIRKQQFQDSSSDFMLLNACRSMVQQFCYDTDRSRALDCLKNHRDEPTFDEKCRNVVIRRMIEQYTDYRFNNALRTSCSKDIAEHCGEVLKNEPKDKELEGKVLSCLKIQFRQWKLTTRCEQQMAHILRQTALNYHLDPLLTTVCAHEIVTICRADEKDPGVVEECLKTEFNAGNPEMRELCRIHVADLIEESHADINADPILHKACAVDLNKYCSNVPHGAGKHIACLRNVIDNKKPLQPDCYKMLTTRIEMFKNAAKLVDSPNTISELYKSVNESPARRYFMVVALTMFGMIFIIGMFCGRVTRRSIMLKNK